ncbi:PREDICTED: leucine-rich repeat protein 1-like [Elephantulus edwardii]|uniref:leucine-rich repeat protein 1-like n=1 Tax=Elephantulus edwardii TaxID=28737 RepID=UPI0003F0EBC5|nr:PREDICTED: leucine-rich repeat protein 1-like [Elephantulus edwardii]
MKLHCEVEVISRHLPALGLRNRGKGVRAVLSLCHQTPRTRLRPRFSGEPGGLHPVCLLISTLKDKVGTRYECPPWGSRGPRCPSPIVTAAGV